MFIKSGQIICIPVLILTIFVESKYIMVFKEELRKLDKEKLVDLVYDLLIKVDALTAQVQMLHAEVKRLKTPKNSGDRALPPSLDFFSFNNQSLREKSNKKTGGQPGHKGEALLMSPDPDKRSYRGAEIFAILRSVVDTIIKKGGNPSESIRFAINVASHKNQLYYQSEGFFMLYHF